MATHAALFTLAATCNKLLLISWKYCWKKNKRWDKSIKQKLKAQGNFPLYIANVLQ